MKPSPPMPHAVPARTAVGQHGSPAGAPEEAANRTGGPDERPEPTTALHAVSPPSAIALLRGELAWLDAAYHRALRRAAGARDAEAISRGFDEADRLQRRILAGSHRLRAKLEAERAATTVSELPGEQRSTTSLDQPISCHDAA
jgi:hypothetical protein